MKKIIPYFIFLGLLFGACKQSSVKTGHSLIIQDTVRVVNSNFVNDKKSIELLRTFYQRFGITIPKYYLIEDSLALDLNNDKLIDTVIVLSPISLEDVNYSDCKIEDKPTRVLLEIINHGKYSKIRNIYYNLISNIGGVLSKYVGLSKTKNGFEITHESGSRYSWTYTTEFSTQFQDSIFLVKIKKTCSFEGNEEKTEYTYSKVSLNRANFNDTIVNNCNCDSAWHNLQNK